MRIRRLTSIALLTAVGFGAGVAGTPVTAAPAKLEGTISIPALDLASELGAGSYAGQNMTCPEGGQLDGVIYKFFDLKGDFTKFKAYGPTPLFSQPVPADLLTGNAMDYDIDLWAFDKKCTAVDPTVDGAGGSFGGLEQMNTKKGVRYIVITYYSGIHADLPVTLEYSN